MSNKFKQQAKQVRAAIPQIDPEATKPPVLTPTNIPAAKPQSAPTVAETKPEPVATPAVENTAPVQQVASPRITVVDTNETPANKGFFMYPSRHRQIAKDLSYLEDRNPWLIIEDALEEYVVKHYGKEFKRK